MLLRSVQANNFLSFQRFNLSISPGLTVLTGPNSAGKSNVGRCLDFALLALTRAVIPEKAERLRVYKNAGYNGSRTYEVAVSFTLDTEWELELVKTFIIASTMSGVIKTSLTPSDVLEQEIRKRFVWESINFLTSGTMRVKYSKDAQEKWSGAFEFEHEGSRYSIRLFGNNSNLLERRNELANDLPPARSRLSPLSNILVIQPEIEGLQPEVDLRMMLQNDAHAAVLSTGDYPPGYEPPAARDLARMCNTDIRTSIGLGHILYTVMQRALILTENRRLPLRGRYRLAELATQLDLRDGSTIPGELFKLKEGDFAARRQFEDVQRKFFSLTGKQVEIRMQILSRNTLDPSKSDDVLVEPVLMTKQGEQSIELAGAGAEEALLLSVLLTGAPGRIAILDEPAINLEPTAQRRLLRILQESGQVLTITHSADLVPAEYIDRTVDVVRLTNGSDSGTKLYRADVIDHKRATRWEQLLQPTHIRSLLFSSGAILCEGATELGVFSRWFSEAATKAGEPGPEDLNYTFVDVGGEKGFGGYIDYLTTYGIPWVAIADGPAIRHESTLYKQLRTLGLSMPSDPVDTGFASMSTYWSKVGVFTVAEEFGTDGSKKGELESFLRQVDEDRFDTAQQLFPKSKVRCGSSFASNVVCPENVARLYAAVRMRLERLPEL